MSLKEIVLGKLGTEQKIYLANIAFIVITLSYCFSSYSGKVSRCEVSFFQKYYRDNLHSVFFFNWKIH